MNDASFAAWQMLPEHVAIYRGALTHSTDEATKGISWSLSRGYAAAHLYRRTLPIHEATDIRKLVGQYPPQRRLVSTVAPKSAILAVCGSADQEVFVDYELLDPAKIKSLPTNNLLHQAVGEKLGFIGQWAAFAR